MAVQKSRVTRARRGARRSHDRLRANALSIDPVTGQVHRRHHMTKDGYYKGKLIKEVIVQEEEKEE